MMQQRSTSSARPGLLRRARARIFGEADPIEQQLAAIAREGATLARLAHVCAFLMLILFSAGSLVALAGDSIQAIASGHATFPAIIAAGVSGLLVACMDTAMLYAASILRLLAARRAAKEEGRLHRWVLTSVAILEAGTYAYMSWKYEQPADAIAWALIAARALAAPLLSVYLSLARPLPVTARDMLALAERISGEGVLRDLAHIASDVHATLAEKVALYSAAAIIAPAEQSRLAALLDVAQQRWSAQTTQNTAREHAHGFRTAQPEIDALSDAEQPHDRPPTGPGSPASASKRRSAGSKHPGRPRVVPLRSGSAEERVRTIVAEKPTISVRALSRRAGVSESTASKWLQVIAAERTQAAR